MNFEAAKFDLNAKGPARVWCYTLLQDDITCSSQSRMSKLTGSDPITRLDPIFSRSHACYICFL